MSGQPGSDKSNWNLSQWLQWQEGLHPNPIDLGLSRVAEVAARLNFQANPSVRTITVAGTNGKGSTASCIEHLLLSGGKSVGAFSSPHISEYNERIRINGATVSDEELTCVFQRIDAARGDISLTYFEFSALAALAVFRDYEVEVQVLEVGLGGRLDAVNMVDADCAVITNIGLDHQSWLGDTRDKIAIEKAGVMRAGTPAICGDINPPAALVSEAERIGAELYCWRQDFEWQYDAAKQTWNLAFTGPKFLATIANHVMRGISEEQRINIACALMSVCTLFSDWSILSAALEEVLKTYPLPGRQQKIGRYILDVAHNSEAIERLTNSIREKYPEKRIHTVVGMLSDKPVADVITLLASISSSIIVCGLPQPRGLTAQQLNARVPEVIWKKVLTRELAQTVEMGVARAQNIAQQDDLILICGSFLTVAEARCVI